MRRTPPRAYSVADDSTDADLFDDILLGVDRSIASSEGDSNDDDDDNDDVIDGDDSDVTAEDRDPYADDSDAPGSGDDSDPFSAAFGDVVFDLEVDVVRVAAAMLDQGALRAESVDTDQRRRVGGHPAPPRPGRR